MTAETAREVDQALFAGGDAIKVEAQISITSGAVSGANHTPSAPGSPPNNDTGGLAGHIYNIHKGRFKVEVSSNAEYSAALEFGTSKVAARPFMAPAANAKRAEVEKLVNRAVKRGVRRAAQER
ncbi:hypothetical protein V474_07690 [Novosphingobium barchaimii LL02]|uniref:HK97 gp10 family phage protein n=1 Tax=Novosphingobium barchaimii LL02 TaxID=1114963 RepID=A0A0J7Y677_9SPHN|nr:HK97-gp10 family putative phage morphogenesis protein [Novosphingobium barchaimii]KMS59137.1 hypothetical protein V474_07690 [Novosphingobium barchaimii LL02]